MGNAIADDNGANNAVVHSAIIHNTPQRDAVRLSNEQLRKVYEESFLLWLGHWVIAATEDPALPLLFLSAPRLFRHLPALPLFLCLKPGKHAIHASAISIWGSTNPDCPAGLTEWHQKARFNLGTRHPVAKKLYIANTPDGACN